MSNESPTRRVQLTQPGNAGRPQSVRRREGFARARRYDAARSSAAAAAASLRGPAHGRAARPDLGVLGASFHVDRDDVADRLFPGGNGPMAVLVAVTRRSSSSPNRPRAIGAPSSVLLVDSRCSSRSVDRLLARRRCFAGWPAGCVRPTPRRALVAAAARAAPAAARSPAAFARRGFARLRPRRDPRLRPLRPTSSPNDSPSADGSIEFGDSRRAIRRRASLGVLAARGRLRRDGLVAASAARAATATAAPAALSRPVALRRGLVPSPGAGSHVRRSRSIHSSCRSTSNASSRSAGRRFGELLAAISRRAWLAAAARRFGRSSVSARELAGAPARSLRPARAGRAGGTGAAAPARGGSPGGRIPTALASCDQSVFALAAAASWRRGSRAAGGAALAARASALGGGLGGRLGAQAPRPGNSNGRDYS